MPTNGQAYGEEDSAEHRPRPPSCRRAARRPLSGSWRRSQAAARAPSFLRSWSRAPKYSNCSTNQRHWGRDMQSEREPLWRIEDVAEYLAVPVHDVHKMVAQRSIPHFKIGEYLRFRRSDIDQWLDGLAVRCLDRAPRPVAPPVVSHEVSIRSHGLPLEVSSPVPSSTPQLRVPSAPHSPQQPSDPIQVRAAAALEESGLGDQNLQKLVQKLGETNGFRVTVNQQVPEGHTSVDVVLERDGWRLACEISVTSNLEQEIGSIRNYLASGFHELRWSCPTSGRPESWRTLSRTH